MTKKSQQKPAGEMINEFFGELNNLEGMDEQVAKIIQDLWNTLLQNAGAVKAREPDIKEQQTIPGDREPSVEPDTRERIVKYDGEAVKKMMSSGGGLGQAIGRIITSEGINSMLQERSEDPAYWVAAATVVQDEDAALAYLEAAVRLHPDSAIALSSLVNAHIRQGHTDESMLFHGTIR